MAVVSQVVNLLDHSYNLVTLYPGDEVPEWALDKVANPEVLATEPPRVEPEEDEGDAGDEDDPVVVDYSKLKKAELEALCAERELDAAGTKADLIERLIAADAAATVVDVWAMSEGELRALAAERGVDVGEASTAAELAAVLEASEG